LFGSRGNQPKELIQPYDACFLSPHFSTSIHTSSPLLLVADCDNKRLSIWSVTSNYHNHQPISQIPVTGIACGVCVDLKGLVYVSCYDGGRDDYNVVEVREPRMGFRLLQILGGKIGLKGSGVGKFDSPMGMCVDENNTLMVADAQNHRVHFFD
jgi:sugar lactone lactonase YvrE